MYYADMLVLHLPTLALQDYWGAVWGFAIGLGLPLSMPKVMNVANHYWEVPPYVAATGPCHLRVKLLLVYLSYWSIVSARLLLNAAGCVWAQLLFTVTSNPKKWSNSASVSTWVCFSRGSEDFEWCIELCFDLAVMTCTHVPDLHIFFLLCVGVWVAIQMLRVVSPYRTAAITWK